MIVLIVGLIVLIENVFEMFVNESRACGRVCGLLSILRPGLNGLVQSCPIVRIVKILCNIKEYCIETKEYCEKNETLTL